MPLDVRAVVRALANDLPRVHAAASALQAGHLPAGDELACVLGVAGLLPNALASRQLVDALERNDGARAALRDALQRGVGWRKAPSLDASALRRLDSETIDGSLRELGRRASLPPAWVHDYREHLEEWQDYLDDTGDSPDYDEVVDAYARVAEALALPADHPVAAAGRRLPEVAESTLRRIVAERAQARFSLIERLRSRLPADMDRALDAWGQPEVASVAHAFSGPVPALKLAGDLWVELQDDGEASLLWGGAPSDAPHVRTEDGVLVEGHVGTGDDLVRWPLPRGGALRAGDLLVDVDLRAPVAVPHLDAADIARVRADATVAARLLVACGTDARRLALAAVGVPAGSIVILAPSDEIARGAEVAVKDALARVGVTAEVDTDVYADAEALVLRAEAAVARSGDPDPGDVVLDVGALDVQAAALVGGLAGARGYRIGVAHAEGSAPPRTYLSPRHAVPEDPRGLAFALFAAGALPEAAETLERCLAAGFIGGQVAVLRDIAEALLARADGEKVDVSALLTGVPEGAAREAVAEAFADLGEAPDRAAVMDAAARIGAAWETLQGGG